MANNKPIDTLRDGSLKATLWKNSSENGAFYSVNLARTYKDEADNYQDTDSFSGSDLLRIARLAGKAYDRANALRRRDQLDASGDGF